MSFGPLPPGTLVRSIEFWCSDLRVQVGNNLGPGSPIFDYGIGLSAQQPTTVPAVDEAIRQFGFIGQFPTVNSSPGYAQEAGEASGVAYDSGSMNFVYTLANFHRKFMLNESIGRLPWLSLWLACDRNLGDLVVALDAVLPGERGWQSAS